MKSLVEFVKENLLSSFDADAIIDKLKKLNYVLSYEKVLNEKYSAIKVTIDYSIYDDNYHKKFESMLNIANYFVSNYSLSENNILTLELKPRITECITEYVYKQRYIYHLTTKEGWVGIQKSNGIKPKNSKYEIRPKQVFLFIPKANFDNMSLKTMSNQLFVNDKHKRDILLKIDLEYVGNDLKFYIDPAYESNELIAIYTRDFIPKRNKESFTKYEI